MYVRKIDEVEINFRVSGMLWDDSLIMEDEETKSLWSHILGECVEGRYKGQSLEMLPAVLTDLASWQRDYPDSTVMNWPHAFIQNWKNDAYEKLSHDKFAIGLILNGFKTHFRFTDLLKHPLINTTVNGNPILLLFDIKTGAAWCFNRNLEGETLEFEYRDGTIVDTKTESAWSRQAGLATQGPLADKQLQPIVVIPSQIAAWKIFHPDSVAWQPLESAKE